MTRNPIDLPPEVAQGFVDAMLHYFAEDDPTRRDAIAVRQLKVLQRY